MKFNFYLYDLCIDTEVDNLIKFSIFTFENEKTERSLFGISFKTDIKTFKLSLLYINIFIGF